MKVLYQLVALAAVALAPVVASATPPPPADLTVLAGRGQRFTLALDGRPLTSYATRQVHASWLPPGQHQADVQVYQPYGPPTAFRTTIWLQPGVDSRFALASGPYGFALQPLGGTGGPYGAVPPVGPSPYPGSPAPYPGSPAPGPAYPTPPAPNGGYGTAPGAYPPAAPGGYDPNAGAYPPAGSSSYAYPNVLSPADADGLIQALHDATFDNHRLPMVQQSLSQTYLQANQLAAIVRTMDFDDSQRRVAVLGYAHLVDPQNFYQVLQALTFSTTANRVLDELNLPR